MRLQNEDILSLKTNSLHLLLQKTPDFHFNLATERQASLTPIFEPLLEEAIKYLKSKTTERDLPKNQEKQKYACALLALISKAASHHMSIEAR